MWKNHAASEARKALNPARSRYSVRVPYHSKIDCRMATSRPAITAPRTAASRALGPAISVATKTRPGTHDDLTWSIPVKNTERV